MEGTKTIWIREGPKHTAFCADVCRNRRGNTNFFRPFEKKRRFIKQNSQRRQGGNNTEGKGSTLTAVKNREEMGKATGIIYTTKQILKEKKMKKTGRGKIKPANDEDREGKCRQTNSKKKLMNLSKRGCRGRHSRHV